MSVVEPGSSRSGMIDRIRNLLLQPGATWEQIDVEPATVGGLFRSWVVPLAAIGPVCGLIGSLVFGHGAFGITYRPSIGAAIASAVTGYVMALVGVYVLSLIIDALAPNFGGERNKVQAFKVAAYTGTAGWVAGVFQILPALTILAALAAFYNLYLLYKGLPRLMKAPEDKATPYTVVVVVVALVIFVVIGAITGAVTSAMMAASGGFADRGGSVSGTVNIPGGASVNLGKLEESSRKMEQAAAALQSGQSDVKPADPEALKGFLPQNIGGYARTEVSSASGGVGGMTGSSAKATYSKGEAHITVSVTDMGAAGALAGMANAFNIQSSSESDGRYEKVGKVNGRTTMESFDKNTGHGEYGVLVGDRIMVQAEGEGASIDELKAAVGAVGPDRLEGLAKG